MSLLNYSFKGSAIYLLKRFLLLLMLASAAGATTSCSGKKKLAEQQAAEQARLMAADKQKLRDLLSNTSMSPDEKQRVLNAIKGKNYNDPEIRDLIRQAEQQIAGERSLQQQREAERVAEEARKREEERRRREEANRNLKDAPTIYDYFNQIVNSGMRGNSNQLINQALGLFANDNVPVLIIVFKEGDTVDYDEPTTARKYFEYLKDQQKDLNEIYNIKYDVAGKISELELIRKGI
jgi:hypothetical protein